MPSKKHRTPPNDSVAHTDQYPGTDQQPIVGEADQLDTRHYLEIKPSETPLDPRAATQAMELLFTSLQKTTRTRFRDKLTGNTEQPVVEWLIASDGRPDTRIRYLVGSDDNSLLADLKNICRTCFPDSYEITSTEWHPRRIAEHLPVPDQHTNTTQTDHPAITPSHLYVASVEYDAQGRSRYDWQSPFTAFEEFTTDHRIHRQTDPTPNRLPLATLVETMRTASVPVLYQVVCRPLDDWGPSAAKHIKALENGQGLDGLTGITTDWGIINKDPDYDPPPRIQQRIDGIAERDTTRTFTVSARAVAVTREAPAQANTVVEQLAGLLDPLGTDYHVIDAQLHADNQLHAGHELPPGTQVYNDLCDRVCHDPSYETFRSRLPFTPVVSKGMVVETGELPGFCLLGGAGLSAETNRALSTRRAERTGLPLPPPEQLARYAQPGIALCEPLTNDRQPYDQTLSLPPTYQNRHLLVVGDSGAGKSVLVENGILTNHQATDGPEILIDSKGGGTAEEYLRAHYTAHGNLEDVYYFDCTEVLPAISFFDIEPLLEAGIPRDEASARKAGQYEEILAGVMGAERYGRAVDAPKVIRNHVKALFDGVNGDDAFAHRDLYATLRHTMEQESAPTVSDDRLDKYFANLLERDREVFQKVMGGAVGRVDSIATDARLAPLFNHVADERSVTGDTAHFDFAEHLDEDCVIIFDFGGMEDRIKRTLTLVILANLWAALKARTERASVSESLPLVNLYLEEAADVADTQLVDTLLSQGRSFDLSVTLGLQYPQQLQSPDTGTDTYLEALNETGTFVVGNVNVEGDLAHALATGEPHSAQAVRSDSSMVGTAKPRQTCEAGAPISDRSRLVTTDCSGLRIGAVPILLVGLFLLVGLLFVGVIRRDAERCDCSRACQTWNQRSIELLRASGDGHHGRDSSGNRRHDADRRHESTPDPQETTPADPRGAKNTQSQYWPGHATGTRAVATPASPFASRFELARGPSDKQYYMHRFSHPLTQTLEKIFELDGH
jgi:hypothetical protein